MKRQQRIILEDVIISGLIALVLTTLIFGLMLFVSWDLSVISWGFIRAWIGFTIILWLFIFLSIFVLEEIER